MSILFSVRIYCLGTYQVGRLALGNPQLNRTAARKEQRAADNPPNKYQYEERVTRFRSGSYVTSRFEYSKDFQAAGLPIQFFHSKICSAFESSRLIISTRVPGLPTRTLEPSE
jgi:hypothetical protein